MLRLRCLYDAWLACWTETVYVTCMCLYPTLFFNINTCCCWPARASSPAIATHGCSAALAGPPASAHRWACVNSSLPLLPEAPAPHASAAPCRERAKITLARLQRSPSPEGTYPLLPGLVHIAESTSLPLLEPLRPFTSFVQPTNDPHVALPVPPGALPPPAPHLELAATAPESHSRTAPAHVAVPFALVVWQSIRCLETPWRLQARITAASTAAGADEGRGNRGGAAVAGIGVVEGMADAGVLKAGGLPGTATLSALPSEAGMPALDTAAEMSINSCSWASVDHGRPCATDFVPVWELGEPAMAVYCLCHTLSWASYACCEASHSRSRWGGGHIPVGALGEGLSP